MNEKIIELKNLSKFYTGGQAVVVGLNEINLSFYKGELVAVTGESGSGKTTLGHVLGGIIPYESGELLIEGKATSHFDGADWEHYRRDRISFISQSYGILPGNTVLGNVTSALRLIGYTEKQALEKAGEILKKVELWDERARRASKLSSGQKQRLSIARALAKPSPVLIADEPTGNLDTENSAKVIRLLAEAARDRLVILITHDYAEVEAYATRRIVMQDGRIVSDGELRGKYIPSDEDAVTRKPIKNTKPLGAYIARLQMKTHPLWCAIMIFFLCITAFAVFAFLGTFITSVDDTSTRIYNNTTFRNGDTRRIVVKRNDSGAVTDADIRAVLSVGHAEALERYGYIADCNCYYREGKDYNYAATLFLVRGGLDPLYEKTYSIEFMDDAPFMRTVPALREGETFLSGGRLPESYSEVVINENEGAIGDSIRVFLRNANEWAAGYYIAIDAVVVGTTEREGIYLSDDVGRQFTTYFINDDTYIFLPNSGSNEKMSAEYGESMFRCSSNCYLSLYQLYNRYNWPIGNNNYMFASDTPDSETGDKSIVLSFSGAAIDYGTVYDAKNMPFFGNIFIQVTDATFAKMTSKSYGDQLSLKITDYAYTERVINELNKLGYIAVSPYVQGSSVQSPKLAEERLNTLIICASVLLTVLLLEIILVRALFSSQTESYKLLSDIGLTCKWAKTSAFLQIIPLTLIADLLCAGAVFALGKAVGRVADLIKYLEPPHIALMLCVHLTASVAGALWVAGAIKKRVFPFAGRYTDISFDDEEGRDD